MANFLGLVYATLKANKINYKNMSTDEAINKFNEITKENKANKITSNREDIEKASKKDLEFVNNNDKQIYTEMVNRIDNDIAKCKNIIENNGKNYIKGVERSKKLSPSIEYLSKNLWALQKALEPFPEYRSEEPRIRNAFIQAMKRPEFYEEASKVFNGIKQKQEEILNNKEEYINRINERNERYFGMEYEYQKNVRDKYNKLEELAKENDYVISVSPYSMSTYAIPKGEKVDWDYKPENSYRVSNHWNWEDGYEKKDGKMQPKIHCPTDTGEDFGWAVAVYKNGKYHEIK